MIAGGRWKPPDLVAQVPAPAKSFCLLNVFKWSRYWGQLCAQLSSALEVTLQPARSVRLTQSIFSLPETVTNIPSRGWVHLQHYDEAAPLASQPGLSSTQRPVLLNWEVCRFLGAAAWMHLKNRVPPLAPCNSFLSSLRHRVVLRLCLG